MPITGIRIGILVMLRAVIIMMPDPVIRTTIRIAQNARFFSILTDDMKSKSFLVLAEGEG